MNRQIKTCIKRTENVNNNNKFRLNQTKEQKTIPSLLKKDNFKINISKYIYFHQSTISMNKGEKLMIVFLQL